MKKMLIVMNHKLTEDQEKDLRSLGIEWEYMSEADTKMWGNMNEEMVDIFISNIRVNYENKDYYLIQGHMGATFKTVLSLGAKRCWYAQTDRVSEDVIQPDGSVKKVAVFKHKGFYSYL